MLGGLIQRAEVLKRLKSWRPPKRKGFGLQTAIWLRTTTTARIASLPACPVDFWFVSSTITWTDSLKYRQTDRHPIGSLSWESPKLLQLLVPGSGILHYQIPKNVEVSLDPCELPGRPMRFFRILYKQKHCQLAPKGQRWNKMKEGCWALGSHRYKMSQ